MAKTNANPNPNPNPRPKATSAANSNSNPNPNPRSRSKASNSGNSNASSNKLRIVPLGGLGEIGKNMTVFEMGNDAFIVDTGLMFPANDMLGVDYIIPDFQYLINRKDLKIHGIVYTHGHEDHTGAVTHVVDAFHGVPIYATPLTAGLLENKLKEGRLLQHTRINTFNEGDTLQVGPFKIETFHVCHSIPQCAGLGIHTPHGIIVHTGDFKFDQTPVDGKPTDYAKLGQLQQQGVLLLLSDSTNADRPGWTPSEAVIDGAFDTVFRQARGRIMVATFASLISRFQQVANAAQRYGRKVAVAGHSMNVNSKIARTLGLLKLPDSLLVDLNRVNQLADNQVVIMVTGSQGEPSSVLARIANGNHRQLEVEEGDTIVLSSHPIPGNEEMVYRTINQLIRRGAHVIYDPVLPVHVSGHGSQEEMRLMLNLTRPKYFMPVHGEMRHLYAHAELAVQTGVAQANVFVAENGNILEIDERGVRLAAERLPGGYVFVDGSGVGDTGRGVIRDRELLSQDGFVVVVINLDSRTGKLKGEPEIVSRGFSFQPNDPNLMRQIKTVVSESLAAGSSNGRRKTILEENLSKMFYSETKRRPVVMGVINEL